MTEKPLPTHELRRVPCRQSFDILSESETRGEYRSPIAPSLSSVSRPHAVKAIACGEEWRTGYYMEDVVTPIHAGRALVSEQWENCNVARTNAGCGHEKWWFAPGLGLVKVQQIDSGSGNEGDEDPKITMLRVK